MIIVGQFFGEAFMVARSINPNLFSYLVLHRNSMEVMIIFHSLLSTLNVFLGYAVSNFYVPPWAHCSAIEAEISRGGRKETSIGRRGSLPSSI